MEAILETTGGQFPAHTYLLDSNNLVAYIPVGATVPFYFKNPIKGFDKRGRKFLAVKPSPFTITKVANEITVTGSKGQSYTVNLDAGTCTCPGYQFRGACKHVAANG